MNVRITPRGQPQRTNCYGGVTRITVDGGCLFLHYAKGRHGPGAPTEEVLLSRVAEVVIDEDGGTD